MKNCGAAFPKIPYTRTPKSCSNKHHMLPLKVFLFQEPGLNPWQEINELAARDWGKGCHPRTQWEVGRKVALYEGGGPTPLGWLWGYGAFLAKNENSPMANPPYAETLAKVPHSLTVKNRGQERQLTLCSNGRMRQPRGHSSPGDFQLHKIRLETSTELMRNTGTELLLLWKSLSVVSRKKSMKACNIVYKNPQAELQHPITL